MVRKTVTLVFCDVADSTPLGEQLDPEALRGVWSRYHDTAREVLERHGGTIEKFVGDAVLGVFGIPVVHEDDALRAVRAAVELRGELARLNDELEAAYGIRIGVRTGIHTGEVYAGDPAQGDPFATGDAVVVAQRLESTAAAGEILVGDATIRLVRDAVTAEPMPALELKGKSEPVDAWRLLDVEPDAAGVARRMDSPLIGRAAEFDALLAELERVVADRACRIVTIVGEPGIGKSRLAAELIATAGEDTLVLEGRCLPYGNGITYWPLVEVIRDLDLEAALAGEPDGETVRGRILEAVGRAAPRSRTDELYSAIRRLLETLARERPVVLVLDDIQWAEPAFLDLVEYLAGWSRDAPILVCCMARPDLAELRPAWGGTTIQLAPLPRSTRARCSRTWPGRSTRMPPTRWAARPVAIRSSSRRCCACSSRTASSSSATGGSSRSGRSTRCACPDTVQAVLAARLDRLGEDELAVLQRAAVIGQVFWWGAVADLSPPEEVGAVAGHLQALVRKGLIKPDARTFAGEDGFRFGHILIRDAAYDSMPKRSRAELHERFAGWAEDHAGEGAELDEIIGHHLEQAYRFRVELGARGEEEDRLAGRAADRLCGQGGAPSAAATFTQRGRCSSAPPHCWHSADVRRLELAPELGLVLTTSGALSRAEEVLTEVIEHGDGVTQPVVLAARIERVALRVRSDPRGGWEEDLALIEVALPGLESTPELDRRDTARRARLVPVGLVRGLWAGQCQAGEEALLRARATRSRRAIAGRRRKIVRRIGFAAWSGPLPVHDGIGLCVSLLESAPDDLS